MNDKTKNSLIINLLVNFWIVIVVSVALIIYYSLNEFGFLPEGFPILLFEPKDIVGAALTFIGICIAFNGLNIWKSQLSGKYDFDLACQAMRDISNIRIAYINFSTMWIFANINPKKNPVIIRMEMLDDYFHKLNDLRSEINKFRTIKYEIETSWNDFPYEHMNKMMIKAGSYLTTGEKFISYCQSEVNLSSSSRNAITFNLSDQKDQLGKLFFSLCTDILIKPKKIKLPFTPDFRKNYIEFISSHEQIRLYLKNKIKQYISTIG